MAYLKKIFSDQIVSNISILSGGNVIVQLIPICFTPFLTRIYSPEEYGVFSKYYVAFGLFSILATGRYEYALLHPKSDEEVSLLVKISFFFSFLIGILIFFTSLIYSFFSDLNYIYYVILPLSVIGIGTFQTINSWLNRLANYKKILSSKLIQNISKTFFELFFGIIGITSIGLFLGHVFGILISNCYLFLFSNLKFKITIQSIEKVQIIQLVKKYKDYPLYNLPFSFIDRLASSIPLIFVSTYFSYQSLGYFSFTERIIYSPFSLISAPISMVLLKEVSELYRENKSINNVIQKITKILIYLSIVPFLFLILFSNLIFPKIFGIEWTTSGKISSILALSFIVKSIISPLSNIFIAINLPKKIAQWQSIYLSLHLLGVGLSLYINSKNDILFYAWIVVYVDIVAYGIYYFMIYKANNNYNKSIL